MMLRQDLRTPGADDSLLPERPAEVVSALGRIMRDLHRPPRDATLPVVDVNDLTDDLGGSYVFSNTYRPGVTVAIFGPVSEPATAWPTRHITGRPASIRVPAYAQKPGPEAPALLETLTVSIPAPVDTSADDPRQWLAFTWSRVSPHQWILDYDSFELARRAGIADRLPLTASLLAGTDGQVPEVELVLPDLRSPATYSTSYRGSKLTGGPCRFASGPLLGHSGRRPAEVGQPAETARGERSALDRGALVRHGYAKRPSVDSRPPAGDPPIGCHGCPMNRRATHG